MGWNERSDPDMRTANFCDVYREGVYRSDQNQQKSNNIQVPLQVLVSLTQYTKEGFFFKKMSNLYRKKVLSVSFTRKASS